MKKIVIASNNLGKIKEIKDILGNKEFEFLSMNDVGFHQDVVEDQDSFEGNALKKASSVMEVIGEITLADDSGLEVDILDGQPGIFSARFSGENPTDKKNNEKLLELMKHVPHEDRGAQFRCVIALILPDGRRFMAEGICRGKIAGEPSGNNGFGYDAIFIPEGLDKTFGELPNHEKNQISHRFKALNKLREIMVQGGLFD